MNLSGRTPALLLGLGILIGGLAGCRPGASNGEVASRAGDDTQPNLPVEESGMTASRESPTRLAVLWTSGDREVALNVAFMYTRNAKARGWFDEVTLIVWGPSARLLSEDEELQAQVGAMVEVGVELVACRACADNYGVAEALEALGIEVKYMGEPLTEILQGDWEVITF